MTENDLKKFRLLQAHYYVHRSNSKGKGKNKTHSSLTYIRTDRGDIPIDEWVKQAEALIEECNEQYILDGLIAEENGNWLRTAKEKRIHCLKLHIGRIFDNPGWLDYVRFNQKYRPEILSWVNWEVILPQCCKKEAKVPLEQACIGERIVCPVCGNLTIVDQVKKTSNKGEQR